MSEFVKWMLISVLSLVALISVFALQYNINQKHKHHDAINAKHIAYEYVLDCDVKLEKCNLSVETQK